MSDGAELARGFPARIAEVLNSTELVINRGAMDGVEEGQRFLVYSVSDDEIEDPETGESLGRLELVKGKGRVFHVQERMASIRSDTKRPGTRRVVRRQHPLSIVGPTETEEVEPSHERVPFDEPQVGDLVKPL